MGKKLTTEEFIQRAIKVHNGKYTYRNTLYTGWDCSIIATCPIHGDFKQSAYDHLQGKGCQTCGNINRQKSKRVQKDDFIKRAIKVHNGKYSYDNVEWIDMSHEIQITCPIHGLFPQLPTNHLQGKGCSKCGGNHRLTNSEFIEKIKTLYHDKYDVSLVKYINNKNDVELICKLHGNFKKNPYDLLNGHGCSKCTSSSLENVIRSFLIASDINFIEQANKSKLDWMGIQSLDFYLPDYNVAIECQGEQHFKPFKFFGWKDKYDITIKRDQMKLKKCQENGVTLLYYSNLGIDYPYQVYEDKEELLKEIYKHNKVKKC